MSASLPLKLAPVQSVQSHAFEARQSSESAFGESLVQGHDRGCPCAFVASKEVEKEQRGCIWACSMVQCNFMPRFGWGLGCVFTRLLQLSETSYFTKNCLVLVWSTWFALLTGDKNEIGNNGALSKCVDQLERKHRFKEVQDEDQGIPFTDDDFDFCCATTTQA